MSKDSLTITFVTVPDEKVAQSLSIELVSKHLAACVNILPGIRSVYIWEGKLEAGAEFLLLIKSTESVIPKLHEAIQKLHPYVVPEIVSIPASHVNQKYLDWVKDSVK